MDNPFKLSVASNDAFREIFQSMTEGIIVVDSSGKILVSNPVADQMFGYSQEEMSGMQMEELVPDQYKSKHVSDRSGFNNDPVPRRMGLGMDLAARKKDGQEFPVEISLNYSKAGGKFLAIAFIMDISIRVRAQEALRQSEEKLTLYTAELERTIEARTRDLNASIARLESEVADRKKAEEEARNAFQKERELSELKSRFVSITSHEFRTPLSAILSSVSLLSQYMQRGEQEKAGKHVQRIKSSVNHLTAILNDLLSLSKLEEGKVEVKIEPIDLKLIFTDIIDEARALLKEGQEIILTMREDVGIVESDRNILRNVLLNLLSNASKYSLPETRIRLMCIDNGKSLSMSVRDEGIGIPEEEMRHLFERFFRASNVSTIQGTGLGLNIVKRYATLLGGYITFSSKEGEGSTFTITIPK